MEAFVSETRLSSFFSWRKLMSCTVEYGLLITSDGLDGSMDQNLLYIEVQSKFVIILGWLLGFFACEDHTGSNFSDVCKCEKEMRGCFSTGKECCSFREGHCKTARACFCLLTGWAQLMLFWQDEDFVSVLWKTSPSAAITGPFCRSWLQALPFRTVSPPLAFLLSSPLLKVS